MVVPALLGGEAGFSVVMPAPVGMPGVVIKLIPEKRKEGLLIKKQTNKHVVSVSASVPGHEAWCFCLQRLEALLDLHQSLHGPGVGHH